MPLAWTNQYYGEACTDRQNCKDSPYPEYAVISCFRCICLLFCWLSYIFRRTGGLFRRRCRFFSRIAGFRSIRRLARICRLAGIRLFSIRIAAIDRSDCQHAASYSIRIPDCLKSTAGILVDQFPGHIAVCGPFHFIDYNGWFLRLRFCYNIRCQCLRGCQHGC